MKLLYQRLTRDIRIMADVSNVMFWSFVECYNKITCCLYVLGKGRYWEHISSSFWWDEGLGEKVIYLTHADECIDLHTEWGKESQNEEMTTLPVSVISDKYNISVFKLIYYYRPLKKCETSTLNYVIKLHVRVATE